MEFRKMVMITLYAREQKRHRCTNKLSNLLSPVEPSAQQLRQHHPGLRPQRKLD